MTSAIVVPHSRIPAETLQCLLEDFATREGTDYGDIELDLTMRVDIIRRQLQNGDAVLIYALLDESLQIITLRDAKAMGIVDETN
ncbi:MAG TPA: YheU family protein [Cellvibrionaceae bacterium]